MLQIQNITKSFGGVKAVDDLSWDVRKGDISGLIGPNGAGKTTLFNIISGFLKPNTGHILLNGQVLDDYKPHQRCRLGLGRTFQIVKIFSRMTVYENMMVPMTYLPQKLSDNERKAFELLTFFRLKDLKDELAMHLSGGQQKLLELARISMLDPDLYLLDEPYYGIHPELKSKIIEFQKLMNSKGKTFVVVSHDIPSIMGICNTVSVMCTGRIIATGSPEKIRSEDKVIEAYLGD